MEELNQSQKDDKLVVLQSFIAFNALMEADTMKSVLESEGIPVVILNDSFVSAMPHLALASGGVKLAVLASDYERAKAIVKDATPNIRNDAEKRTAISEGIITCHKCGSDDVVFRKTLNRVAITVLFLTLIGAVAYPFIKNVYKCNKCGYKWAP